MDTGSSDLWCNAANSTLCSSSTDPCSTSGTYDSDKSTTYTYVSSDFNISYADGTGAAGVYATDTLHIGGSALEDFQFGIGYSSSSSGTWNSRLLNSQAPTGARFSVSSTDSYL